MNKDHDGLMPATQGKQLWGPLLGLLAILTAVFLKFKVVIFAGLKALPLLKLGWLLKGFGSMFLSLGLYAMAFGWPYAITLIGLIYVHEMGHYLFMKVKGLKPQAPVFVPFLGAYVAMTNLPKDPVTHAWVAYAGPLVGGLAAAALQYAGIATHSTYLIAAANTGYFLNLFQLLPVRPFDGGFLANCISRWLAIPGTIAVVLFALHFQSVILLIISAVVVFMLISQWRRGVDPDLANITLLDRLLVTIAYFGLAFMLGWLYWLSAEQVRGALGR